VQAEQQTQTSKY